MVVQNSGRRVRTPHRSREMQLTNSAMSTLSKLFPDKCQSPISPRHIHNYHLTCSSSMSNRPICLSDPPRRGSLSQRRSSPSGRRRQERVRWKKQQYSQCKGRYGSDCHTKSQEGQELLQSRGLGVSDEDVYECT
jgi:hypothetical protein